MDTAIRPMSTMKDRLMRAQGLLACCKPMKPMPTNSHMTALGPIAAAKYVPTTERPSSQTKTDASESVIQCTIAEQ